MAVGRASRLGRAARSWVGVLACCCAGSVAAAEASKDSDPPHRYYAGISFANLDFHDQTGGIQFHDTSFGLGVFGGAHLQERLSLELSFDSFVAIDLRDLAGSGVSRFDVRSERRTVAMSVVREVSMRDVFEWRRDWRLFGMAGVYRSSIDRSVTVLGSGSSSIDDRITGALLGGGVLYRLGSVDLRGYFREFGVLGDKEAREFGFIVQRKF